MKPIAVVTGATGVVGSTLVRCLLERGYRVRALVRCASPAGNLPESVEVVRGDITDCRVLRAATENTTLIFHSAAKLHVNNPSSVSRAEYRRVNVEGTRRLVEAALATGVRRLVFFSTINVYGASEPREVLNEDSPLCPDSWYAETKAEGEQIVLAGLPAVVLRLAAVYGPCMKGNYLRLLNVLRRGGFAMIGDGRNRRTLVHVSDVCEAALVAAEQPAAAGRTYNVTDGSVHTFEQITDAMSAALGRRPRRVYLPVRPARLAAGLLEDVSRFLGKESTIGRRTVDKLVEDIAVSGTLIQRQLGYRPRYDLAAGWRATVSQLSSSK